ncbi:MAG: hypothetical protein ABSD77_03280 [Verrucomicrobiota bacterium]|jgi:hypothetical protein
MIRVPAYPEPADFNARVRIRGKAFLAGTPRPNHTQWKSNNYWTLSHDQLYKLYRGICVYSASWTSRKNGSRLADNTSIDHFLPKSIHPNLAFEWSNFRLCRSQLNQRKDDSLDVMDPFAIDSDWFQLDFFTFRIEPNPTTTKTVRSHVKSTTIRLGLNDEGYIKERIGVLKQYCVYGVPLAKIERNYPFIAREIRRTDFDTALKPTFARAFGRSGLRN